MNFPSFSSWAFLSLPPSNWVLIRYRVLPFSTGIWVTLAAQSSAKKERGKSVVVGSEIRWADSMGCRLRVSSPLTALPVGLESGQSRRAV